MKKLVSVLAVVAFAATATIAFAGAEPGTGVVDSMHDINKVAGGYNKDDFQRVCVFCHTPHNALPNGSVPAPLWNHAPSTKELAPYTWAAPTNLPIEFNADPLVGPSRLCMACHDGVTAVDSHGSAGRANNGNTALTSQEWDEVLGVMKKRYVDDLTITHPIGFLWADAVAARNLPGQPEIVEETEYFLKDISQVPNFDTRLAARASYEKTPKQIKDTLYAGYFTCASCHEVHNTNNAESTAALSNGTKPNYFLWAPEQGSTICLSCHIK